MIIKGLTAAFVLFILPVFMGLTITCFFKKEKCNLFLSFAIGYIIEFAVFQLFTVPAIYLEWSFTKLYGLLIITLLTIFGIGVIAFLFNLKVIFKDIFNFIKKSPKILLILSIILIGIQIYAFAGYMHLDDDDSFYVGTATTTLETDSVFKYSGCTGQEDLENMIPRYRIGPFPVFTAFISKFVNMHPVVIAHVVLPIPFIILVYCVYALLANKIFDGNLKKVFSFVLLMCLLNIYGNYSGRTNASFLLMRVWQGKSMLANFILPVIVLLFLYAEENNYKFINLFTIFLTMIAAVFTTTMGIGMPAIELALIAIVFEFSKIKIKREVNEDGEKESTHIGRSIYNLIKCAMCCIPSIAYLIAYIKL